MAGTVSTTYPQKGIVRVIWSALSGSENGNAASIARWPDKTVQVFGTFTNIIIEGSNDGTTWAALHDFQGNELNQSAPSIEGITENPLFVRARSVGASGCTVLIVGRQR